GAARGGDVCDGGDHRGCRAPPARPGRRGAAARSGLMLRALVGPTASGKTDAGIVLATRMGAEIASVDSMLVYRGMDVGTAKPTAEQRRRLPHHLVDLAEPSERFTVARYQGAAQELLALVPDTLLVGACSLDA